MNSWNKKMNQLKIWHKYLLFFEWGRGARDIDDVKSQNRWLYPDKKIIEFPNVIESEKSSPTPQTQKNHRQFPHTLPSG